MDFSKNYIDMCEKAEELQNIWTVTFGDYYLDKSATYRNSLGDSEGGLEMATERKSSYGFPGRISFRIWQAITVSL